jgi:hypothetical protein
MAIWLWSNDGIRLYEYMGGTTIDNAQTVDIHL